MSSALSTLNTITEVRPLSKALNPQLLPGRRCIGCPLLWVCVHSVCLCVFVRFSLLCVCTWMVKCIAQAPSMESRVTSFPFLFTKIDFKCVVEFLVFEFNHDGPIFAPSPC